VVLNYNYSSQKKKNDTTKAQLERTIDNFWLSQLERKYILRQTYNNEKLF